MKRRMKKFISLLLAFSMIFSLFTVPVQASPADNTKTEQTAESDTTAADDNQVNTAEEVQPEEEQPEEEQPEAAQPEEEQPEAAQPEEEQPAVAQPEASGQQTFSLRGGSTSFRLDPDGLDVSSVSAYNVVPEDGAEVDENDPAVAALAEELSEVEVQAEDEEGNTVTVSLTEEQIQNILGIFQLYQDQWKDNADVLGVQLPFFLSYNDSSEDGLGILGEMLVLAGHTVDEVRSGEYSYDDLMGMIQNFYYADQYGVKFYKEDIVAKRTEVLQKVEKSGAQTFVQKLLVINDWLAHQATFDMAYIMNMGKETPLMVAEEPAEHPHYQELYAAMYEVYEGLITQQFHDQIYAGVVAQLRQQYYEGFIKTVVYNQALGKDEAEATEEEKEAASAAADQFMEANADAIKEDAVAFVTENLGGEDVASQMVAGADAFITDAEENGVEVDPENNPGYKMTVEELTQQTMDTEIIVDLDGDGENESTANEAIPAYTAQAASGLANGILGAWEGNHIGILAEGKGVCAGYSKAFAYLVQYMCPEIYGINGAETDMSVASNWKTAQDLYYDEDGNLDITREYNVDMIRITFDADTSMFGEESNFGETHFWNAVQVGGKWYYVDPCYTDIYVECMSRDRVEIDGTMNHMYFMFSHSTALEMYDGNMKDIAGLYGGEGVSDDTSYEDSWFARIASNSYFDDGKVYYMYDSSDQLAMMEEFRKLQNSGSDSNMDASDFEALMEGEDPTYSLVYHTIDGLDVQEGGADSDFTALIEFNHKEESSDEEGSSDSEESVALVYNPETGAMEENELLTTLFAQYKDECDIYPSIKMTAALYGEKLYFNLSNCILSYELSTGKVEKVKEYNTVYGKRDKSNAFGGMGFSVCSAGEADLSVTNHPIAALTIKDDGKMYVSVATNYAFISGKSAVDDSSSYGYEFEESNYNPNYSTYMTGNDSAELEEAGYSEETNDNDEFMWSAVFVDTINVASSCDHSYASVTIAPTCGRDGYTEKRCTKCGAPEEGSRVVDEGSALDAHHYVHFAEQYYTKDDDGNWNTGECYVCTVCGFAIEEPDEPREDAEQEEIDNYTEEKAIWDNAVATAGHTYEPTDATWSNGSTSVTFSHLECSSVCPERQPYLDCLLENENKKVSVAISAITVDAEVTDHEGNCEDGVTVVYTAEGVTEEGGYKYKATNKVQQAAGVHTYVSEFTWADNTADDAEVPYTATADVKCEVCGTVIAEDVEADVTYDEENSTSSTCGEAGKKVYVATATVTDAEGNEITTVTDTKEVELGLLEHEWDKGKIEWQEATEDEDGKYIAVVTCKNCGETHEADATLEKDEESYVEPGCETEGKDVYQASATVVIEEQEITVIDTIEETIAALGHDWNKGTITWNQVADEEGYATGEYTATAVIACNRCKESHEKTVDAVKDEDSSIAPTCTEDGTNVWTVSIDVTDDDGNVIGTVNGSKEVTVPATGHTFGEWVVTKEATDIEKGSRERECSVCGYKETDEIPMLDHTEHKWDEGKVTKEATCTEKGEKTYTCTVCNETYTEEIAATGHTEVIDDAVAATCTETGLTEGSHCSVCNTVLVAQEIVPAKGHSYENGVCTECGEEEPSIDAPVIKSVYSKVQTSVKVTWNKVDGATGYELWRTDDLSNGKWACAKTISSGLIDSYTNGDGDLYYTNQGLTVGTTYYYKVRSYILKNGATDENVESRIYSDFSAVDYMPAAVVFGNVYSNSTSRIRILWNEVGGSHGYQIWRKDADAADSTYTVIKTLGDKGNTLTDNQGATTAYSNTGLEAGKEYTYKMRAFYIPEDGKKVFGAYSDEITVAVIPEAVVLTGTSKKDLKASLSWEEVSGAKGYQIWMSEAENGTYSIVKSISDGSTTSYTKGELTEGKTYYFKVRAYVEVNGKKTFGEYSNIVSILATK